MIEREVSLRSVGPEDEAKIRDWYRNTHVSMYCKPLPDARPRLGHRVITWNGHSVGYIEWREAAPLPATADDGPVLGAIELQIIIGEPGALGFTIGTYAVRAWLAALSLASPGATVVGYVSSLNTRGMAFFERLGFRQRSVHSPSKGMPEFVLTRAAA